MLKTNKCPFCGSTDTHIAGREAFEDQLFVCCFDCGATGPSVLKGDFENIEEAENVAVAAWNRRVRNRAEKSKSKEMGAGELSSEFLWTE